MSVMRRARLASEFGEVLLLWSLLDAKIHRVFLPIDGESPLTWSLRLADIKDDSSAEIDAVCDDLQRFLRGQDVRFDLDLVAIEHCPPFRQQVLRAEHGIPRGAVSSYGRIARHLGNPKAARAVGTALASNPFPLIVPCHRALRSDMTLGGFQGGMAMKAALLELEGHRFSRGRVWPLAIHYDQGAG